MFQPLGEVADRLFEPPRKVLRALLALFHARHDFTHGLRDRREIDMRLRLRKYGLAEMLRWRAGLQRHIPSGEAVRRADFIGAAIHDDLIEPRAKRHARAPRCLLCRLARFGLDALNTPGYTRSHANHCPLTVWLSIGHKIGR